jgi:hypothetical protein
VIKNEAKVCRPYNNNTVHVECKNNSSASNNTDNWNHLKNIEKHLNNIKVKHYIKETQQTATLGIAHIFRRVLK